MYESGYRSVIRLTRTSRKTELCPATWQAGLTSISAGTRGRDGYGGGRAGCGDEERETGRVIDGVGVDR